MVLCRVLLLDGKDFETDISRNAEGAELFEEVCKKLNINEKEYFGLTYTGTQDVQYWVNHEKKIAKQVKSGTWVFEFAVKFYPPEPSHLSEDVTRYQLCLQIRADIYNGKLPCSFMTHAILGSYTVQAEIGDYDPKVDGPDDEYLKAFDFAPQQTPELSQKIHELHKTHKGQTPEEAELNFLENAKKLAMYGVDLHKAKDDKNQVIMLGVCSSGLQLYRDKLRINRFVWPKIIKLTYKRNNFYIKLRQTEGEQELNICFKLDSHKLAKRLWKTCVEHHTFFRLKEPEKNSTGTLIPRFNSRFRYSGRTQKQIREQEDLMDRPKVKVERRGLGNSFRMPRDAEGNIIHPHGEGQPDTYDRTDKLPGHTDTMSSGPPPYSSMDRGDKSHRKPGETEADRPDTTEDRRDKMLGNHDQTEGAPLEAGDSALLEGGMALQGNKKSKEDKEREKREKEEEKQRKKDAEKERKRLEKEKKKHKDTAEDRTDRMGDENATETAINGPSDSMGLDSDALLLGKPGSNAPKSDGSENPPKEGENLELVKSDKAHDKYKDKKESKKGGGLFGMLKKTPSKGKGDKNKPGDTNVNNRDLPTDGSTQENKIEETMAIKQKSIVPDENIEDEVFAESDSVKPVIESNSKLVNGVKERKSDKSEKRGSLTSSSSSSSEEGEMVLEHRTSNIIEEVCSGPSSPTSLGGSDNPVVVISVHNKEEESVKVEEECSVKVVNNPKDKDTASQKDEKSPVLEVKTEKIVTENEVEVKLNEKRSSNPAVSEISNTEIVASAIVNSDNTDVNVTEEKAVVQEEVCKELESPPEVPVVLTNEEAGREDVDEGSSKTEKKVVEPTKDEKKRQKEEEKKKKEEEKKGKKEEERRKKEEEKRQKEEEKKRIKQEHIERKRREREEKERKKQEKLQSKRKSVKGEVEEKQEVESQEKQAKSSPVPPAKEGKISEETKVEGKSEEQPKEMLVKIKVLPKSDTDTSILGQEVYDDKSKEKESVKETAKEEVKEKQEEGKDQKNKKSKKKKPEQKKKSSTGCFSFVRHHKSSDSEEEVARIELPTEPWPSEKQEAEEVEKSPEEPKVKTPPKQKGGVGMGWALPGLNEFKDRAKQGGFGLSGTHPDYSDKSIDRKMQFIAVTPPSTEVYDRQKGDHPMPFFEPVGSTSDGEGEGTLGKKKPPPVAPKKYRDSQDDKLADIPPTVATERMRYDPNMDDRPIPTTNVPIVKTQTRTVTYEKDGIPLEIEDGILISSQSHSTRTQTIETTTYKTERDGKTETRVEKKVVISQEENGDDIDHDALLAEAIKSVTEMNPDLSVERIECMRQIEEIDGRY